MPRPVTGRSCACSPAGTSRRRTSIARTSPRTATRTACRWAATSASRRPVSDRPSWSTPCAIPMAPTSIASRSSRAGSTRMARARSAFSTWRYPADARSARTGAARPRWATPSTWRTRATRTPSAHRRCRRTGKTRRSTRRKRAFYYVRVIQIPSPRWTAYDQKRFGIKMPDYVPMTVTDRAYTSPIWYSPN